MDRLISEQAVIDAVSEWLYDKTRKESIETVIKAIPSAEPSGDCIRRADVLDLIEDMTDQFGVRHRVITEGVINLLPSVKPQEPSITWVTGADGAKIAFWDVPVWKVTKICEILGEP